MWPSVPALNVFAWPKQPQPEREDHQTSCYYSSDGLSTSGSAKGPRLILGACESAHAQRWSARPSARCDLVVRWTAATTPDPWTCVVFRLTPLTQGFGVCQSSCRTPTLQDQSRAPNDPNPSGQPPAEDGIAFLALLHLTALVKVGHHPEDASVGGAMMSLWE